MDPRFLVSTRPTLPALLCLICALVSLAVAQSDTLCSPSTGNGSQSTCVCQTDAGQIIDLRPLSNSDGKSAKFSGIKDAKNQYSYNYNPCTPFTDGTNTNCKNVFICQHALNGGGVYTVANQEENIYKESSSGKYYVHYTGPPTSTNDPRRDIKVYLNCNQRNRDGKITSITQPGDIQYALQLDSCHACPGGCSAGGGGIAAGIIGIVLIVVIIVSLVAYFIIGALLMKFQFHASGTDVIPNKTFWIQLPLLIKDGFVFTFGPCFKFIGEKTGARNDYQKI